MKAARRALVALLIAASAFGCATSPRPAFDDTASAELESDRADGATDGGPTEDAGDAAANADADPPTPDCANLPGDPQVYVQMYMDALLKNAVRRCTEGCSATECCYDRTACLARP